MSGDPDSNLKCVASGQAYSLASVSLRSLSRSQPQAIPSRASGYLAGAVSVHFEVEPPQGDLLLPPFLASLL